MATWQGILYDGKGLLDDEGVPLLYDVDAHPEGPPDECCCEDLCSDNDFTDDFSTDKPEWIPQVPAFWSLVSGRLRGVGPNLGDGSRYVVCRALPPIQAGTKITIEGTFFFGTNAFSARLQDSIQNFGIFGNINETYDVIDGFTLNNTAVGVTSGDTLKIEITFTGTTTNAFSEYFVNGASIFTGSLVMFDPEFIGFGFIAGNTNGTVEFDDFSYTVTQP